MIDTIKPRVMRQPDDEEAIYNLVNKLNNRCEIHSELAGNSFTGMLRNWTVKINSAVVTFTGSLCKDALVDNVQTLTHSGIIDAIERLKEDTGLPIHEAFVDRLDIGHTFIVEPEPELILPFLASAPRCRTHQPYKSTREFRNTRKSLVFYDKKAEMKKGNVPIHPSLKDVNLFRYELRFPNNQSLSDHMKLTKVTVSDVIRNYHLLIHLWSDGFESILKLSEIITFNPTTFNSVKSLEYQLMKIGIDEMGGYPAMEDIIAMAKKRGVFSHPSKSSHFKTRLKKIIATPSEVTPYNYVPELAAAIQDAKLYALSELVTFPESGIAA